MQQENLIEDNPHFISFDLNYYPRFDELNADEILYKGINNNQWCDIDPIQFVKQALWLFPFSFFR